MSGDGDCAAGWDPAQREFDRIDGAVDAAIVFAIAAQHAYQNERPEQGEACLTDARRGYTEVLDALSKTSLTGTQLQCLKAKLIRLRYLLDHLRTPGRNEAA